MFDYLLVRNTGVMLTGTGKVINNLHRVCAITGRIINKRSEIDRSGGFGSVRGSFRADAIFNSNKILAV